MVGEVAMAEMAKDKRWILLLMLDCSRVFRGRESIGRKMEGGG